MKKISLALLALTFMTLLSACFVTYPATSAHKLTIKKVLDEIDQYENKEIALKGTVVSTTNIRIARYYVIQDETGTIKVNTEAPLPKEQTRVKVTGKVVQKLKIGNFQNVVILETKRKDL